MNRELPYIEVTFLNPQTGRSICSKTLIDTGASITCIPERFIQMLDLQAPGVLMMVGVGGNKD